MEAWLRDLRIKLSSSTLHKTVIFGDKETINLAISVDGCKYLSTLKDNFTVKISNLSYLEICQLISGQFYDVEIIAGYKSSGTYTLFKGGVLYITNELGDRKTNSVVILCAANAIAKYGQSRLNLTMNSGINMYAALKFLCRRAGIADASISEDFKRKFIKDTTTVNGTISNIIDEMLKEKGVANSDSSSGNSITAWNAARLSKRVIKVNNRSIIFTGGYPRLTSEGVRFSLVPTLNIIPGDVLVIDNSILDLSVYSRSEVFQNKTVYLDTNGEYVVFEAHYTLNNRSATYALEVLCKSRQLVKSSILGGGQ